MKKSDHSPLNMVRPQGAPEQTLPFADSARLASAARQKMPHNGDNRSIELRREAGIWLKSLREKRGLSQTGLANAVGVEYYSFVSQIENGRSKIPSSRYRVWAEALGIEPRAFTEQIMKYYDPESYRILFEE